LRSLAARPSLDALQIDRVPRRGCHRSFEAQRIRPVRADSSPAGAQMSEAYLAVVAKIELESLIR
jgi:hypothetical protein